MPVGVMLLLAFGFVLLAALGLTLPLIINLAIDAPVSPWGILWMLLLAYLIFTLTLILQRKQAAWALGLGLASLSVPIAIVLYFWASIIGGLIGVILAAALFWSLRGAAVRAWFNEP
jgi:hypothetical protein